MHTLASGLVELEKSLGNEKPTTVIEEIFRATHSLKGAARAVSEREIELLCHSAETVFAAIKREELELTHALIDLLHDTVDVLGKLLTCIGPNKTDKESIIIVEIIRKLENAVNEGGMREKSGNGLSQETASLLMDQTLPGEEKTQDVEHSQADSNFHASSLNHHETIRISVSKLDALLFQIEGFLSLKQEVAQRLLDVQGLIEQLSALKREKNSVTPSCKRLKALMEASNQNPHPQHILKLIEYVNNQSECFNSFGTGLELLAKLLEQDKRHFNVKVDGLLQDMKKALMQPMLSMLQSFPKLVRDIAHDQKKQATFVVLGAETEMDRRILDEIRDPLTHLVRNSIDHGIELPEVREKAQKPSQGTISITIKQVDGNNIEILVSDDGAGVDLEKIKREALKLGLMSRDELESYDDEALLSLIFKSGVSSSEIISDLSGRGLGLAIVWENIEKLGGQVSVESKLGEGTTFRIVLPLTLATFRGVYVGVRGQQFLIPTAQVVQCLRLSNEDIKSVENRELIVWQGESIAVISLADVLELPVTSLIDEEKPVMSVLILESIQKRIAFFVDDIFSEEDVLVKPFNKQLSRVRNVAGATLFGNGKVIPILNVADLIRSVEKACLSSKVLKHRQVELEPSQKSILVVEDSITSRTLLKNILETAGYSVASAVDGVDAFEQLHDGIFDLVVSDVDMPRMNGFELTEKIRADKTQGELPVVLVTALDSNKDRERGATAGANAYIVKRSFDQSNLLDVVRRLI